MNRKDFMIMDKNRIYNNNNLILHINFLYMS